MASIIITSQKNNDLSQGFFVRTHFSNGSLSVSEKVAGLYHRDGFYESPIIDLGERYRETLFVSIQENKPGNSDVEVYTATSTDGYNFSDFVKIGADRSVKSPPGRFIKLRVVLKSQYTIVTSVVNEFTADEADQFEASEYVEFDGSLRLKTLYVDTLNPDPSWVWEGALYRKEIDKTKFTRIEGMEIV